MSLIKLSVTVLFFDYNNRENLFPNCRRPQARAFCTYSSYQKTISRWQTDIYRPRLTSFGEFAETMSERSTLKEFDGGHVQIYTVPLGNAGEIGLIADPVMIQLLAEYPLELLIESTQELIPTDISCHLTIALSLIHANNVSKNRLVIS